MSKIEIFSFIFIDSFIDFKELCCISLRSSTKNLMYDSIWELGKHIH